MIYLRYIQFALSLCFSTSILASQLDSLSTEQKTKTYSILIELENNLYDSEIVLIFADGQSESYNIYSLKAKLLDIESFANEDALFDGSFSDLKSKKVSNPKIHFFSKISGIRFASFQCKSFKIGKMQLGLFEVPSNKILIDSPSIQFY
jgi:hypothetical protein